LSIVLANLQSTDIEIRETAFDELKAQLGSGLQGGDTGQVLNEFFDRHPAEADQTKIALFRLLAYQNELPTSSYSEVVEIVASLNDERAIPGLAGAIDTGQMAMRALMRYGDKALGPVLEKLQNPDPVIRSQALTIALALLESKQDKAARSQMRNLVEISLNDKDPTVRGTAVRRIACLDDRQDFVPRLEGIAKVDPDRTIFENGDVTYPVRSGAKEVLQDIRIRKPCNPGGVGLR
jgi:HEAT repeat protein